LGWRRIQEGIVLMLVYCIKFHVSTTSAIESSVSSWLCRDVPTY
jgi:hypothetical protein